MPNIGDEIARSTGGMNGVRAQVNHRCGHTAMHTIRMDGMGARLTVQLEQQACPACHARGVK